MEETQTIQTEIANKPKKRFTDTVMSPEAYQKKKSDERNKLRNRQKRK